MTKWVNTSTGVPIAVDFTTTGGLGTPIVIDTAAHGAYYLTALEVVQAIKSGGLITARNITMTGNVSWTVSFDGSADVTAVGTIQPGVVTLAMQANMATASVIYRKTAGAGAPEVQTLATLKTDLGLTGTNSGDQTSIVGISGTLAQFNTACTDADFVPTGLITASGLTMATASLVYRKTAATGAAEVNTLATLKTDLSLDGANSGNSYKTIHHAGGSHIAGRVAGTYFLGYGDALGVTGTGTLYPAAIIYIAAADFPTVNSVAPKLRVRANLLVNDVAPTGNYTIALHPVTRPAASGAAGVLIITVGAAVASSAATIITAPAADSSNTTVGADFALPADGYYVLGVVTTATVAVSSLVHINAFLQQRNA